MFLLLILKKWKQAAGLLLFLIFEIIIAIFQQSVFCASFRHVIVNWFWKSSLKRFLVGYQSWITYKIKNSFIVVTLNILISHYCDDVK